MKYVIGGIYVLTALVSGLMECNAEELAVLRRFDLAGSRIQMVGFTANGKRLVCRANFGTSLFVLDGDAFRQTHELKLAGKGSYFFCAPDSEKCLVINLYPTRAEVVTLSDGEVVGTIGGVMEAVWDSSWSADGRTLVLCGSNRSRTEGRCVMIEANGWSNVATFTAPGIITSVSVSREGDRVRFCTESEVFEWSRLTGDRKVMFESQVAFCIVESPDGGRMCMYSVSGVEIADLATGVRHVLPRKVPGDNEVDKSAHEVAAVAFIPESKLIAISYARGGVAIWDLESYTRKAFVKTDGQIFGMCASTTGNELAVCGGRSDDGRRSDGFVCVFSCADLRK